MLHTIDPVGRASASASGMDSIGLHVASRMALLLFGGGLLSALATGCGTDHVHPFRPNGADGGIDQGTDVHKDAGPDLLVVCPVAQVGYSTIGDGGITTGGGAAPTQVAATLEELRALAGMAGPMTIAVHGTLDFVNNTTTPNQVEVTSNKTIVAAEPGAGLLNGGLLIKMQRNVIVRNLTIAKPLAPADAITIQASDHVWIDHCDFSSDATMPKGTYDGLVDITHGSNNVTVSWTRFHDHLDTSLVGHSTMNALEDTGNLTVTFHHNLFLRTPSGSPRARFGHVHVFGNHYQIVDSYAVASAMGATVLVEGNVFDQVALPITTRWEDPEDGNFQDLHNLYNPASSAGDNIMTTPPSTWRPPYDYMTDSTDSLRFIVDSCAGVSKVP
jgi:pectate lyase